METITSKSNPKIVFAKKLQQKKVREETGLFLIETEKVVNEAIDCGIVPKCFYVLEGKEFELIKKNIAPMYQVSASVFKQLSTLVSPDGIIAECYQKKSKTEYLGGRFLILDGLQNPDNFGAIMRTAVACDFKQIYAINCVDQYNAKVIRASMGNQFKLSIAEIKVNEITEMFKSAKLYTASMEGQNIFDIETFEQNVGVVIGNEGNGVSEQLKKMISSAISIPMKNGVESLNASISASIVMYYIFSKQ